MIHFGQVARELRESLGLTLEQMAERLSMRPTFLNRIEEDQHRPSESIFTAYRDAFGIDLMTYAWCLHGELDKLPEKVRESARQLSEAWKAHIAQLIAKAKGGRS